MPLELTEGVLEHLDLVTILACRLVSRALRTCVDTSMKLQYLIALAANGMQDGPPGNFDLAERFSMLQKHEEAWRNLQWSEVTTIPIGRFGKLHGNVWAHWSSDTKISFCQLPSRLRAIEQRSWEVECGLPLPGFGIDPSQDLLVLVERHRTTNPQRHIHFRSLSTGQPHVNARSVTLTIPDKLQIHAEALDIQVFDDRVGIRHSPELRHGLCAVTIWDWKTGSLELCFYMRGSLFIFLDKSHVLSSIGGHLTVYYLPQRPSAVDLNPKTPFCTFNPTHRDPDWTDEEYSFESQAYRSYGHDVTAPFSPAPEDGVILGTINVSDHRYGHVIHHKLSIKFQTLRAHITRLHALTRPPGGHVLPWHTWGHDSMIGNGQRLRVSINGMRCVFTEPGRRLDSGQLGAFCDFHPLRVRRASNSSEEAAGRQIAVPRPSSPQFHSILLMLSADAILCRTLLFEDGSLKESLMIFIF
ncbi:hypothetical protein BV25DRAFT_1919318 [Artomyces pyxidatus]|uniref:Uncharacterized protein n=1 Tax=Artomyces pyxidatus TaxID=48021 RepID=A0ACB8SPD8_9AGAM|nr:hypothetical protein BV25DRAFT_1919318 [Artomyces pyxidatus]